MPSTAAATVQDKVNRAVYFAPGVDRYYRQQALTPAEAVLFERHQELASGSILDVGVGTGRTTRILEPQAERYEAIDYSPVMVEHMRRTYPGISCRQADWRNLEVFASGVFDFVFGTDNVIDALAHDDRLRALAETARVLRPGGVAAFSSHNICFGPAFGGPSFHWSAKPRTLAANTLQFIKRWRNHRRVGRLRQVNEEYALLNDEGHDYACLHYYASRGTVQRQLAAMGLPLVEVIDHRGRVLPEGADDSHSPNLLYVARKG